MAQEKNLENRIKQFLKDEGCYFIKYWGGGGFTKAGVPDLLICCNGHFIAAELKAENGKPSELQIVALTKIQKAGGIGVLVFPEDAHEPGLAPGGVCAPVKKVVMKVPVE